MSVLVPDSSKIMRRSKRAVGFKSPQRLIQYLSNQQLSSDTFMCIINNLSLSEKERNNILNNPDVKKRLPQTVNDAR